MARNYATVQLSSAARCSFEMHLEIISSVHASGSKFLSWPIFVVSPHPLSPSSENNIGLAQPRVRQSSYFFVIINQI